MRGPSARSRERLGARQNVEVAAGTERSYGRCPLSERTHVHMADSLDRLLAYQCGCTSVVWAHNRRIGGTRATGLASAEMVNIGHLARERYSAVDSIDSGGDVVLGFVGRHGGVNAGTRSVPMRTMPVPSPQPAYVPTPVAAATTPCAGSAEPPPSNRSIWKPRVGASSRPSQLGCDYV